MTCPACPHAAHDGWCPQCNCYHTPQVAHARNTDPWTSHAAAESISDEHIRRSQQAVYDVLIEPMDDKEIRRIYQANWRLRGWPQQEDSGIRTRRNELVEKGLVKDSGETIRLPSGRRAILWERVSRVIDG